MSEPDRIVSYLRKNRQKIKSLLVMTHDYPDPDSIASAFALYYLAVEKFDIRARIVYSGTLGRIENKTMVRLLRIPLHKYRRRDIAKSSHIALVDTQPGFDNNSLPDGISPAIVIDQHLALGRPRAELRLVEKDCGATSVLLARSLLSAYKEIPLRLATALTYGILTDTRNLVDAKRHDIIPTFMKTLGFADVDVLSRIMSPERSQNFIATVGRGICDARILGKLLVSHLRDVRNPDVVAYVADYLIKARGVDVCLCTGRYGNTLRISLRTRTSEMRADRLIRRIVDEPSQAGGHGNIAGGMIRLTRNPAEKQWREKERTLGRRLRGELRIPSHPRSRKAFGI
jgi:nanoRNase/pAp phosphatase (c-di-AMP/oligoRNAs hydrolase)